MSDQTTGLEAEATFLSLADLAAMDTDDIAVLTSRLPDEGIYLVRGSEVNVTETVSTDSEKPNLFRVNFNAEILEAKPLGKDKDPESYVGRTLKEGYVLWPTQFRELIGLLKGRYKIVGLPFTGAFGGVEGSEPGWVDGAVNHVFRVRVNHFTDKNKNERAGYTWLPEEDKKAA